MNKIQNSNNLPRNLPNWLDAYMEYTEDTEPARIFQKWTGKSTIAGALRKKVCLSHGRLNYYPNLYVVFVAEPGRARKSQAINFGLGITSQIPELITSADIVTREALLQDFELYATNEQLPDGTLLRHSSISVISREFESFLGQKKENTKMLVMLTDLFDAMELPYKYRVKNSASNTIPSIFLNLQAATTPESLASCLPSTAIGGGLTSRILFVWADNKHKKVAKPVKSAKIKKLEELLVKDLYAIARMIGIYELSKEADSKWEEWYSNYDEDSISRVCKDPAFNGWYSRKPTYILKCSIINAASRSGKFNIEWEHIQEAIDDIESLEKDMGIVFKAIGKSTVTSEVDMIIQLIKKHRVIAEKTLMSLVWRDLDSTNFDYVINTAIRTGRVIRQYKSPKGITGEIWYYSHEYIDSINRKKEEKELELRKQQELKEKLLKEKGE